MMKMKKTKDNTWLFVVIAVLVGWAFGYCTHFVVANWHSFFVTCPSGNKPDKNGCCDGEVYTDAGGGWMVCCPNDGDNCFPPMK